MEETLFFRAFDLLFFLTFHVWMCESRCMIPLGTKLQNLSLLFFYQTLDVSLIYKIANPRTKP